MTSEVIYRFGPFAADRTTYRVLDGTRVLDLSPKLLDLLFYFLERPATLITKEALLDGVWPGANVSDNAVAQAISELREAIGDDPSSPTYIRTVARRGYRFIAEVGTGPRPAATSAEEDVGLSGRSADDGSALAVLDFTNVAGDPEIAWLGPAIAETVTSDLAAIDGLRVVDRRRVVNAYGRTGGALGELASALDVPHVVTGSYQRSGSQLRITARIVHLRSGEAIADAKVDGSLDDVFALQDRIAGDFARKLGLSAKPGAREGVRETSSLDAYRAVIEGNLKIESLDTDKVRASIADFERAIAIDPRYAIAYTGLANAELVAFEMTRLTPAPDHQALASGIEHARHALRLDDRLAEAHGTLSFLLTSAGRFLEARAAAHRAVALDPENWRHHYRLAHASWGEARLRASARTLALYPEFAYAALETAFVHVARGDFDAAEEIVRRGATGQDGGHANAGDRFPAVGFHWLRGLLRRARGDLDAAAAEFDCELANANPRRLYGPEYAAAALVARGQTELAQGLTDRAVRSFQQAFAHVADLPQAHLGLAAAFDRLEDLRAAGTARQTARLGIDALRRTNREREALLLEACDAAIAGNVPSATSKLDDLVTIEPPSYFGWTIPLEPFLRPLHGTAPFAAIVERLNQRAG